MGFFILGYLFFCIILISNMTFPVELVTGAVFLGGAFFVYIIVHISQRTIAALQTAEAATALARDDWKNTFDAATDMITVHDADFNIIRANPAARTLLGLQIQEELPLVKCFRCYHGTENPPSGCASCQSLVTGKPSTLEIFEPHLNRHLEIRAIPRFGSDHQLAGLIHVVRDITERKRSDEKLQRTLESLRKALGTTIQVLVSAVETRDPYTAGHQLRSADLARAIATEMGLPSENIEGIRIAGSIHDIGKLSIPAEILSKPTKLSEIEFALIKEHAHKGFEMLKDVESPWPLSEIVYQHHERMDGSGYPRNLKGEEILIEARILAVADVVEAMASHRPYRPGLGIDAALKEIEKNKGIFYDDAVADACLRLFREKGFKLEET
jgi:putative nucleotidyltransferase with HDIG domain